MTKHDRRQELRASSNVGSKTLQNDSHSCIAIFANRENPDESLLLSRIRDSVRMLGLRDWNSGGHGNDPAPDQSQVGEASTGTVTSCYAGGALTYSENVQTR